MIVAEDCAGGARHAPQGLPSDRADAGRAVVAPLLPPPSRTGRPEAHDRRDLLDAIFSQLRQGGAWRGLPRDFPPWQTVYWWFQRWIRDGTRARVVATLRERDRMRRGRHRQPAGEDGRKRGARGDDGGKKVKGRTRNLLVDADGLILERRVLPADSADRETASGLLAAVRERFPRLELVWADRGDTGERVRAAGMRQGSGWRSWRGRSDGRCGPAGVEPPP